MPSTEQAKSAQAPLQKSPKPSRSNLQDLLPPISLPPVLVQRAMEKPHLLTTGDALRLQRVINNRAVTKLLEKGRVGGFEAIAGGGEPDQERPDEAPRVRAVEVSATLRKGSDIPETHLGKYTPSPDAITAQQTVGPTGTPTVTAGGGNDCTPGNEALDWNVVEAGENYRANVVALNVSGQIHITDWPNNPTSMTVPNTPNPVDGGNINNTSGSLNQWEAVIDDMADYDNATGGGAGRYWHSTAASSAHEWTHWNQDYLGDALRAGNWTQTNQDIDAMTVPKSAHADTAAARTALEPRVTTRFNTFVAAVTTRWNAIINGLDRPGRGGRGYAAGMAVLNGLIASVRSYADSKGWESRATRALRGAGKGALIGAGIGAIVGGPVGAAVGAGIGGLVGGISGYFS